MTQERGVHHFVRLLSFPFFEHAGPCKRGRECVPDGPLNALGALEPDVDDALSPTRMFKLYRGKRERIPSTSLENDFVPASSLSIYPSRIFRKIGVGDWRVERLSMYTLECASESWIVADSSCPVVGMVGPVVGMGRPPIMVVGVGVGGSYGPIPRRVACFGYRLGYPPSSASTPHWGYTQKFLSRY